MDSETKVRTIFSLITGKDLGKSKKIEAFKINCSSYLGVHFRFSVTGAVINH